MSAETLTKFEQSIGLNFQGKDLLLQAFTHRSYLNENKANSNQHNERLEFLGDAVLELVVTEFLFSNYPERPEGDLTSFRSAIVKTESLAETAAQLGMGEYIMMSKGEEATGGRKRPYILANTFEAVLGAIYLDQGMQSATEFVNKYLFPKVKEIVEKRLDIDNKSRLQELSQEELNFTPSYQLISESGPDHDKTFVMGVFIDNNQFGSGNGKSKQEAEQKAAQEALDNWEQQVAKHFPKL